MFNETDVSEIARTLRQVANCMVDVPSEVEVSPVDEQSENGPLINFIISCNQKDIGKIIGKGGANIQAIRQVVRAMGVNKRIYSTVTVQD